MHVFDQTLLDLVERLKACRVYADISHSVHPKVCEEAADFLAKLHKALVEHGDAYETEL